MICGVVSVAFTRLVAWFNKTFNFVKKKYSLPPVVCPALGGLGAGIIALKYPGILYWGFNNVDEILHTGKTASAPGIWLLSQLAAAKVVATSLCKGSGLVGGLYAPSLMIGAAVGAVFGGLAGKLINSAIPGNAAVAHPQAYALIGMAATLASVCSVPLTSVLLLFELTKDYRILLPLMGAVGLAIWVPSVTNQPNEREASEDKNGKGAWRRADGIDLELSVLRDTGNYEEILEDMLLEDLKVSEAMSNNYLKILHTQTLEDAIRCMHDGQQNCILVVDAEDYLEGILTYGDIRQFLSLNSDDATNNSSVQHVYTCLVSSVCTRGISYRGHGRGLLSCYPDTDLAIAKQLMEAKGIKQLPVTKRGRDFLKERKHRIVAIVYYDSIWNCIREEIKRGKLVSQQRKEDKDAEVITNGH